MNELDLQARLDFIRKAEPLKDTLRSAYTSSGKTESVAEHSWRLTLLVLAFADLCENTDILKLLKMCILHDLGEVVHGDIPAPAQTANKAVNERADFQSLLINLPDSLISEFTRLWDEYEQAATTEAKYAKAFDKIETIMQHNQGNNPADFDYGFNLHYGEKYTQATQLTRVVRQFLDIETRNKQLEQSEGKETNLASVEIKAFVPSNQFSLSKEFYRDIGFTKASDGGGIAYFYHNNCSFLLQDCEGSNMPNHLMMHLLVEDVSHWHTHITDNRIAEKYHVEISDLIEQPWGMREFILSDPCRVQWRIAQNI